MGLAGDEGRPESAMREQGAKLRGAVQAAVKTIASAAAQPPLLDGCRVGQVGHDEACARLEHAVKLLERLVVHGDMFQDAGSDHAVETAIAVRQAHGVGRRLIAQSGVLGEDLVRGGVENIAAIHGEAGAETGADQAGIGSVTAAPIENASLVWQPRLVEAVHGHRSAQERGVAVHAQVSIAGELFHLAAIQFGQQVRKGFGGNCRFFEPRLGTHSS